MQYARFFVMFVNHIFFQLGSSTLQFSNSFHDSRTLSQIIGSVSIVCLMFFGIAVYCLSQCTFPLTYYHAKYFELYRQHEQAEFEDEMNRKVKVLILICIGPIGVVRRGPRGPCSPLIHPKQKQESWQSRRQGEPGGSGPPIDMLGPPIKKLTLSKTAAFVFNFKPGPHLMNARPS